MRNSTRFLTRSALLLALAAVFPLIGLPQLITGVAVNTILYLASAVVGPEGGIIIGCLIPWLALLRGVLPPPLLVAAPFIIIGNLILVLVFHHLRRRNLLLGVFSAALAKFIFFLFSTKVILTSFFHLPNNVLQKVVMLLGLPQLFTALGAGILIVFILQIIPGKYLWENQRNSYKFQ